MSTTTTADGPADATTAGPQDLATTLTACQSLLADLTSLTTDLQPLVATLAALDQSSSREGLMRLLHAELQECRLGTHWRILQTVLMDVVQLIGEISRHRDRINTCQTTTEDVLGNVEQDLEDLLARQGFERFQLTTERFDPARQEIHSTVATDEPDRVGLIVRRVSPGYASPDRVLRRERVIVYAQPTGPAESTGNS